MNIKSTDEWKQAVKEVEKMIDAKVTPLQNRVAELERQLAALHQDTKKA